MEFMHLIKTPRVDNVVLKKAQSLSSVEGTLCLTGHHVIFSSRTADEDELLLLYSMVEHVIRKVSGLSGVVTLLCKNFTTVKLRIPGLEESLNVCNSIETLSSLESAALSYPFFHRLTFEETEKGWNMFTIESERMAILGPEKVSTNWKLCSLNKTFDVCKSYPRHAYIPAHASDDIVLKSAKFRRGGRFPALAYCHYKNGVPLVRCSQPLIQVQKRCKEDERLVNMILAGHGRKGHIIDTRSSSLATSQKGAGVESESNYPQWKRHFQNIDRVNTLAESISKLIDTCSDIKSQTFFSKLEGSGWPSYVESVLKSALTIANYIDTDGIPVLIHGDNSMDITMVLTSLVQVLLNPHCRTIKGFEGLIVREWLWAGHPFSVRNIKVGMSTLQFKMQAPVFLCFMDCVHQILSQYPCSFEFRDSFLLLLVEHSYASDYGTFLFNNQRERSVNEVDQKTISLWSYLTQPKVISLYINPLYQHNPNSLRPSVAPQSTPLWSEMFMKWSQPKGTDAMDSRWDHLAKVQQENKEMKDQVTSLQRLHKELQSEVGQLFAEQKS